MWVTSTPSSAGRSAPGGIWGGVSFQGGQRGRVLVVALPHPTPTPLSRGLRWRLPPGGPMEKPRPKAELTPLSPQVLRGGVPGAPLHPGGVGAAPPATHPGNEFLQSRPLAGRSPGPRTPRRGRGSVTEPAQARRWSRPPGGALCPSRACTSPPHGANLSPPNPAHGFPAGLRGGPGHKHYMEQDAPPPAAGFGLCPGVPPLGGVGGPLEAGSLARDGAGGPPVPASGPL